MEKINVQTDVQIERNQGEILIRFVKPVIGELSLADIGLTNEDLGFPGGLLRMVFEFSKQRGDLHFSAIPSLEIGYREAMSETHWICDFNGKTILDKLDHYGHSTVLLMRRIVLEDLEQRHENRLVLHAEFPKSVHLIAAMSYFQFFN